MNSGMLLARRNLKSLRKPGAGDENWNIAGTTYIYYVRAVVKGPKTPSGIPVSEVTAAAVCLC